MKKQNTFCIVGTRIKELRIKRGLTQFQLATLIGTTQAQIARYETGVRDPTSRRISEIAKALDIYEGYLFREITEKDIDVYLCLVESPKKRE
jgi:transcriptional regulator with XRE-family HTH domain